MKHAVVIGGGISGVTAAHALSGAGWRVTLVESGAHLGGKLARAEVGGVIVDVGAEAMLNLRPEAVALTRAVGLTDDIVHPATTAANLWCRGALTPMPRTLMGVPGDPQALTGIVSAKGIARARLEARMAPVMLAEGEDVSIGGLVEERFGKEVVDRLVEPLLGGVYAGYARELSLRATVPQLAAAIDGQRTLTQIAAASVSRPTGGIPVFAGISGGMGRLPDAVAEASGAEVRLCTTVVSLVRGSDEWTVHLRQGAELEALAADAVVLAVPPASAAHLLQPIATRAAHELDRIDTASMAVVTLAFAARDLPAIPGSGFLTPAVDGRQVKAATFAANKWDWVRVAGDPGGVRVLRASVGRYRDDAVLQRTDRDIVDLVLADLADAIGLSVRPVDSHVQRWLGGLPQYAVGHLDRVAAVRRDVAAVPGLAVCGAAYDGVGIAACVASAQTAASQITG